MFRLLIQNIYPAFFLSFFLLLVILSNRTFNTKQNFFFTLAIISSLVLSIVVPLELVTASYDKPVFLRTVYSAFGYSLRPAVIYFVICIFVNTSLLRYKLLGIPLIINTIVTFLSFFTNWMFSYTEQNDFVRGPIGYLPFIVSGFYMLALVVLSISTMKTNLKESITVLLIAISCTFATVLESVFKYNFLLNTTIAAGLVFYYLFFQVQLYSHDQLTGLLNRRCFYLFGKNNKNLQMIILSIDMNNLKKINDAKGHSAGDKALLCVVENVRNCIKSKGNLYRVGGDEFVAVFTKTEEYEVKEIIAQIEKKLKSTSYSVATGYSIYTPGMDFDKTVNCSDMKMYERKQQMKAEGYSIRE